MIRRKTKAERERKRIEDAEIQRRLREESDPLSNVVLPDPEAVEAVEEYHRALRELERERNRLDPAPEPPACEKHPDWQPPRRLIGQPRPPASMCPDCRVEFDQRAETTLAVYVSNGGSLIPTKEPSLREELAWDRHKEKLRAQGITLPGSDQEREALNRLAELRREEQERNSPYVVVYSRPFHHVEIVRPRHRPKRRMPSAYERFGRITVQA